MMDVSESELSVASLADDDYSRTTSNNGSGNTDEAVSDAAQDELMAEDIIAELASDVGKSHSSGDGANEIEDGHAQSVLDTDLLGTLAPSIEAIASLDANQTILPSNGTDSTHEKHQSASGDDILTYTLCGLVLLMLLRCCKPQIPAPEMQRGAQIRERAQRNLQRRRRRREQRELRKRLKKDTPEQRKVWMDVNMYETKIDKQEPRYGYYYWTVDETAPSPDHPAAKARASSFSDKSSGLSSMLHVSSSDNGQGGRSSAFDDLEQGQLGSSAASEPADGSKSVGTRAGDDSPPLVCVPILEDHTPEEYESTCIICLEDFQKNDVVAWSYSNNSGVPIVSTAAQRAVDTADNGDGAVKQVNDLPAASAHSCRHVFHVDCIQLWLCDQRQDDCPACRTKLLVRNPHEPAVSFSDTPKFDKQDSSLPAAAAPTESSASTEMAATESTSGDTSGEQDSANASAESATTMPLDASSDAAPGSDDGVESAADAERVQEVFFIIDGLLVRKSCVMKPRESVQEMFVDEESLAVDAEDRCMNQQQPRRSSLLQSALNFLPRSPIPALPLRRTISQGTRSHSYGHPPPRPGRPQRSISTSNQYRRRSVHVGDNFVGADADDQHHRGPRRAFSVSSRHLDAGHEAGAEEDQQQVPEAGNWQGYFFRSDSMRRLQHLVTPPSRQSQVVGIPVDELPRMPPFQDGPSIEASLEEQELEQSPVQDSSLASSFFSALSTPQSFRRTQSDSVRQLAQQQQQVMDEESHGILLTSMIPLGANLSQDYQRLDQQEQYDDGGNDVADEDPLTVLLSTESGNYSEDPGATGGHSVV